MLVTAGCPRKIWYNGVCGKEVEESPGDDHAVVDVEETHHRHRGNSNTWTQQLFFFSSSFFSEYFHYCWFFIHLWASDTVVPLESSLQNQGTVQWPPECVLSQCIMVCCFYCFYSFVVFVVLLFCCFVQTLSMFCSFVVLKSVYVLLLATSWKNIGIPQKVMAVK